MNRLAFLLPTLTLSAVAPAFAEPAPPAAAAEVPRPFHEPMVRYLLADLQFGGSVDYYRKFAEHEKDPDSRRAVKEWEAGTRLIEPERIERKMVEFKYGKGMRLCWKGTSRTVPGEAILLNTDLAVQRSQVRLIVAELTLGVPASAYQARVRDPNVARALDVFADGVRAVRTKRFELKTLRGRRTLVYSGGSQPVDGAQVELNSDTTYDEGMVRYQLADMFLGGAPDFYRKVHDNTHDPMSGEAVARFDSGYKVTNLERFERKKVDGKTLITYKGTDRRVDGMDVRLSSDSSGGGARGHR